MPPPLLAAPASPPAHSERDEAFEKRLRRSEAQLRERLRDVPELRPFSDPEMQALRDVQANTAALISRDCPLPVNRAFNKELQVAFRQAAIKEGLPLRTGPQAELDRASAAMMAQLSKKLRDMGFVSLPGVEGRARSADGGIVPVRSTTLAGGSAPGKIAAFKRWCETTQIEQYRGALTTLLQMLQVEDAPTRLLLVTELNKVDGPITGAVLALRAVVDLSPDVREAAIEALRKRPVKEYLPVLLLGLRYPWKPAAAHAAHALTKLKPDGAVPKLLDLLDQPDPSRPVLDRKTDKWMVKEVVRINHLRNCLLCHPVSLSGCDSPVRGAVPTPGRLLLPGGYVGASVSGDFVRADVTFLRQDFSVVLPVRDAAPWPNEQRFDFVTRLRPAEDDEVTRPAPRSANYPQREAVLYALRKLSGKDGGDETRTWRELLTP